MTVTAVRPPVDCSLHHGAFGAGCPWCPPRTTPKPAAGRTPIAAARCATTTQKDQS
jgi:hypothetical protein